MKLVALPHWSILIKLKPLIIIAITIAAMSLLNKARASDHKTYESLLSTISSPLPEYGLVISPDDKTAIFTRMSLPWGSKNNTSALFVTYRDGNGWTAPAPLFENAFETSDAFFSADGRTLFFATNQGPNGTVQAHDDIWYAQLENNNFRNAQPLTAVNSDAVESSPVVATSGNLYFSSRRDGGIGAGDIWMSRYMNGTYQEPENLNAPVNTETGEWNVFVAPNEQYLIVEASGRRDAKSGNGDLYIHTKRDGDWSTPIPLSHINTTGSDLMPRLSPDGKGFFYTSSVSSQSRDTEIYFREIDNFLAQTPKPAQLSLMVVSRSNHEIVALDPVTLNVIKRFPTGKGPHEIAASPNGRTLYAPAYGVFPRPHEEPIKPSEMQFTSAPADTLTRISLGSMDSRGSLRREQASQFESETFTICERSHGVVVTPDTHVWVTCQEEARIMEMDGQTGVLIKEWQLGVKGSHILVATADNAYVVTSNVSAGSISILNRQTGQVKTVPTASGAEGLALMLDQQHVWVGNTQDNSISVVRIGDGSIVNQFPSHGRFPVKMAVIESANEVWVVNTFSREIAILDIHDGTLKEKLGFASPPLGIQSSHDGKTVYATFPRLNEVRAFNQNTRKEIARTNNVMEGDGMTWAYIPH